VSPPDKPIALALACLAAVALVLIVAIADYSASVDEIPSLSDPYEAPTGKSSQERGSEFEDRLVLYSAAIFAIGVAYLLLRLRALPSAERRTGFTDLGVGAVAWLLVVVGLYWLQSTGTREAFDPSTAAPLAAGGGLVLIAGVGSVATWRGSSSGGLSGAVSGLPRVLKLGAGFSLASIVLSSIALSGSNPCGGPDPEWITVALAAAFVLALAAALSGVVALGQRRWFAALLLIPVAPAWAIFAAFATACWN
jgi:hypothetical protein